jgi:hypothetical protein
MKASPLTTRRSATCLVSARSLVGELLYGE